MDIESGGSALATVVSKDASVTVQSGGTADNTIVGGTETIFGGGTISGAIVANGGTLELAHDAVVSGGVAFSNNGTLAIKGDTIPANLVISGFYFDDKINLADVGFDGSGTTSTSGNVLTVSAHGHTYIRHHQQCGGRAHSSSTAVFRRSVTTAEQTQSSITCAPCRR